MAKSIFYKKLLLTQCIRIEECDGVTVLLNEKKIADIIKENVELEQIINVLKRQIYEAGATDNMIMICCKID